MKISYRIANEMLILTT